MAFTIATLKRSPGDSVMYEPEFRTILETHLQIMRYSPATQRIPIGPEKIHQYEGDFYGLLADQGISLDKHWIYMRVNGFESSSQFGQQAHDNYNRHIDFTLLIPPDDILFDLRTLYLSVKDQS